MLLLCPNRGIREEIERPRIEHIRAFPTGQGKGAENWFAQITVRLNLRTSTQRGKTVRDNVE